MKYIQFIIQLFLILGLRNNFASSNDVKINRDGDEKLVDKEALDTIFFGTIDQKVYMSFLIDVNQQEAKEALNKKIKKNEETISKLHVQDLALRGHISVDQSIYEKSSQTQDAINKKMDDLNKKRISLETKNKQYEEMLDDLYFIRLCK